MALRHIVAPVVCLVMALAPQAGALVVSTPDPVRDAVVTKNGATMPVDSVDIVGFSYVERGPGIRAASIEVHDLSRRGLEDRLFVQSAHAYRAWGFTEIYPDYRALNFIAVQVDDSPDIRYAVFLNEPGSFEQLDVDFTFDEPTNTLRWRLQHAVRGEPQYAFAFSMLFGCDDDDTCQPGLKVSAADMAPNELAQPITQIAPPVWWDQVLPQDDGTIPKQPVSLAKLASGEV